MKLIDEVSNTRSIQYWLVFFCKRKLASIYHELDLFFPNSYFLTNCSQSLIFIKTFFVISNKNSTIVNPSWINSCLLLWREKSNIFNRGMGNIRTDTGCLKLKTNIFKASFLPNEFTIFCIWSKSWISTSLGLSLQTSPAVCQVVPAVNLAFHSILKLAKYCKEKKLQDILPKTHKSLQEFLENNFSDICILLILECNCAFSKRTVLVTPCLAKWYKVWHPRLPPPTKIK